MSPQILNSVLTFLSMLAVVSVVGAVLITMAIKAPARVALRPVTQPALTVVGMMFSVLLGFFIAQAMRNYSDMNSNTMQEANALGEVFRVASGMTEVDRKRIRGLCRQYADIVVNDEWDLMADRRESEKAWDKFHELWEAVLSAEPTCQRTGCVYESLMTGMDSLGRYRRARIALSSDGLEWHVWLIIAVGAGVIISVTFLFSPESKAYHAALITCILLPVTLNAYLLAEYSNPYSGLLAIKPTMFKVLQSRLFKQPDTPPRFLAVD